MITLKTVYVSARRKHNMHDTSFLSRNNTVVNTFGYPSNIQSSLNEFFIVTFFGTVFSPMKTMFLVLVEEFLSGKLPSLNAGAL